MNPAVPGVPRRSRHASTLRKVATAAATAISMIAALGFAADPTEDHVIDLPTALRLAGAESVDVQLARERLVEAEADYEAALLRFFPWINASTGYRHHDGDIQDVGGDILTTQKQSYAGGIRLA